MTLQGKWIVYKDPVDAKTSWLSQESLNGVHADAAEPEQRYFGTSTLARAQDEPDYSNNFYAPYPTESIKKGTIGNR